MGKAKIVFAIVVLAVLAITVFVRWYYVQYNLEYIYSIPKPYSLPPAPTFDLLAEAVIKGDTNAYYDMSYYYSVQNLEKGGGRTLCYDFLMANKYHHPEAYYNVYWGLYAEFYTTASIIDEETDSLIVSYLRKGAAEGDKLSLSQLGEHYLMGDIVPIDLSLGQELYRKHYPNASEETIEKIQSRGEMVRMRITDK